MKQSTRIQSGELGPYHHAKFLHWAFVQRQNKSGFARNVLVARTDANQDEIQQGLDFYAEHLEIDKSELKKAIEDMDRYGLQVSQIHQKFVDGTWKEWLKEKSAAKG
ncbi:MAG: hypothetical protein VKL39_00600 [Leptolyngbyaceae bacterium]|nr:hypothetical protein [Leptolyngbyaceae bacterium]